MEKRTVALGSQIFINRGDTPDMVKTWVRQLAQSGLKIIRLFMVWEQLEPEEGRWDFSNYDACMEEAKALGLMVVPTLMAGSPPGWMGLTTGIQGVADITDPAIWQRGLDYVSRIVERYGNQPCLHSWILWNEPGWSVPQNERSLYLFREFLIGLYCGDIAALNKNYFNQYKDFAEVGQLTKSTETSAFTGYAETLDWDRFCVHMLMGKLTDIKNEIRKSDSHPVHVNPHALAIKGMAGQDIWCEAELVDFMGCSAHPSWHSTRFPPERLHQSVAYFADQMRSVTPHRNGEFWVTELQGGTNIFSGGTWLCPDDADIRLWLWESIGSGASAAVFWCFNARKGGFEGGEWSLLNQLGQPSDRLEAATEVAKILEQNQALFDGVRAPAPDVWLLYSESTMRLNMLEGTGTDVQNPRNVHMGADALCGAYLMCSDLGLQVGFINEAKLAAGRLPKGSTLILPGVTALPEAACAAVERHACAGGTVIADFLCGMKDPWGNLSGANATMLSGVFGCEVADIQADIRRDTYSIQAREQTVEGWFARCLLLPQKGAEALGWYDNAHASVTGKSDEGGYAVRIGTTFFQRYLSKPVEANLQFLGSLLPPKATTAATLKNPCTSLRLKTLIGDGYEILILINSGENTTAELVFNRDAKLVPLGDGVAQNVEKGDIVKLDVGGRQVHLFQAIN